MAKGWRAKSLSFQMRVVQTDDGYGNKLSDWVEQFRTRGHIRFLRGREDVLAARLEGRQPGILKVLQSNNADRVSTDWRAQDVHTSEYYNVRSVEPSENRMYVEFLVEKGVADG